MGTKATTLLVAVLTLPLPLVLVLVPTLRLMLVLGVVELETATPAVVKSAGRVTECERAQDSGERPYERRV